MSTDKDLPKRGTPVDPHKQLAEDFHDAIDRLGNGPFTGVPKKRAQENQKKFAALLKSVRAKR